MSRSLDWHGRVKTIPEIVVNCRATTRNAAKAEIWRKARDAGYKVRYTDVQVRAGQWISGFSVWIEHSPRGGREETRG